MAAGALLQKTRARARIAYAAPYAPSYAPSLVYNMRPLIVAAGRQVRRCRPVAVLTLDDLVSCHARAGKEIASSVRAVRVVSR